METVPSPRMAGQGGLSLGNRSLRGIGGTVVHRGADDKWGRGRMAEDMSCRCIMPSRAQTMNGTLPCTLITATAKQSSGYTLTSVIGNQLHQLQTSAFRPGGGAWTRLWTCGHCCIAEHLFFRYNAPEVCGHYTRGGGKMDRPPQTLALLFASIGNLLPYDPYGWSLRF